MLPFLQATQSLGKLLSSPEIPVFDSSVIILVGKNSQRTPFTSIRICMKLRNKSIRICMKLRNKSIRICIKLRNKSIPLFSSRHFQSIFAVFRKTAGPGPQILRLCAPGGLCQAHSSGAGGSTPDDSLVPGQLWGPPKRYPKLWLVSGHQI